MQLTITRVHVRNVLHAIHLVGNIFWMGYTHNLLVEDCSNIVVGPGNFDRNPRYNYGDSLDTRNSFVVRDVGWRVDCLGDLGGFSPTWCHMCDYYPQAIINFGMNDAWKKAPVTLEVCRVMQHWKDRGWDIDYIIDQSLKRHIATFLPSRRPVRKILKPLEGVTRMSDVTMVLTSLSGTTRGLQECHTVCESSTPTGPAAVHKKTPHLRFAIRA